MKKTQDQQLKELGKYIFGEIAIWKRINEYGCNDPFWADGCNMNLTRNHILYAQKQIEEICTANGSSPSDEYYLATPPEVNDNYMATLKNRRRLETIGNRENMVTKRAKYNENQMALW